MSRHQLVILIQVLLLAITIGCFIAAMNGVYVARELAETTPAGLDGEVGARVDSAFSYMKITAVIGAALIVISLLSLLYRILKRDSGRMSSYSSAK